MYPSIYFYLLSVSSRGSNPLIYESKSAKLLRTNALPARITRTESGLAVPTSLWLVFRRARIQDQSILHKSTDFADPFASDVILIDRLATFFTIHSGDPRKMRNST